MRSEQTQAPSGEPLDIEDVVAQCRIDGVEEYSLLDGYIRTARQTVEARIGQKLLTQRWKCHFDSFTEALDLIGVGPVASIVAVKYIDAQTGTLTTLASDQYQLRKGHIDRVVEAYGCTFPSPREVPDAVQIEVECGYGAASSVPAPIKQWMLVQIAHWHAQREAATEKPLTPTPYVDGLLDPYRTMNF